MPFAEKLKVLSYNPTEGMVRIAMDEQAELGLCAQMYKELYSRRQ
ncbi:MAG TPA: hypothetical protein VHK27_01525 [Gammaproteobacteria bacterium]|nr:hypothetical protein [Gammaproteobacteria bacterium]